MKLTKHQPLLGELVRAPQKFGILPSWRFWKKPGARAYARPFMIVGMAVTGAIIMAFEVSMVTAACLGLALPALALGTAERGLRRQP